MAAAATLLLALLPGCTLGPDYKRPEVKLPEYVIPQHEAAQIANLHWWTLPGDPELLRLIRTALASNLTLKAAAARVDDSTSGAHSWGALTAPRWCRPT